MTESIDKFSTLLFEEAKRFLEKAHGATDSASVTAFCHAALLLGFSALEAHINVLSDELTLRPNLDILTQSILLERDYKLEKGKFELLPKSLKMYRLEDRLEFLFSNFSRVANSPKGIWWGDLKSGIVLRNRLVHPKEHLLLTPADTSKFLTAINECLNALYLAIFKKPYPAYNRGLNSTLTF